MNNFIPFRPFSEIIRFEQISEIDDMLNRFMMRPTWRELEAAELQIRMEVAEVGSDYIFKAETPGVKKDDIHVTIDGNSGPHQR